MSEIQSFLFQVFPRTEKTFMLRLFGPGDKLIGERALDVAAVEGFRREVAEGYSRVMPGLASLGNRLYEWLDGPSERWLDRVLQDGAGAAVHIDVSAGLRLLPWELMADRSAFLCGNPYRPFTPARRVGAGHSQATTANRPLRILFMACSPEGIEPVLDFEGEERLVLEATRRQPVELVVEESGSLEGLQFMAQSYEPGHFDVFHLTGHAVVKEGKPRFIMEDDRGFRVEASAADIAKAFGGRWPRLVFLSGCKTGQSPDQGDLPSMAEALVQAGCPAVLGWALPVRDEAASEAAATLYAHLGTGCRLDEAVARARQRLLEDGSPNWHLLRLYCDGTPLDEVVTPLMTPGRLELAMREARTDFLDAGGKVEVASRGSFVGRRRPIQRCLRALNAPATDNAWTQGVLLHGMGGLGKSSLAARVCERMPGHKRLVWVGKVDETAMLGLVEKIPLQNPQQALEAGRILNTQGMSLMSRFQHLLAGPLQSCPALFVFDDFEEGNLEPDAQGGYKLTAAAGEVLSALGRAVRATGSRSRIIITSRYAFPLPEGVSLYREGLESAMGADLAKKCRLLPSLQDGSKVDEKLRRRAIEAAAGNFRLLEWLDKVLAAPGLDTAAIIGAMEAGAAEFREKVLAKELLGRQEGDLRRLLALLSVCRLPVVDAVEAVAGDVPMAPHLARAAEVGLVESGREPASDRQRYHVSGVLAPLLEGEVTAEERREACGRAARHLVGAWVSNKRSASEAQLLEVHRLAMLAGEGDVAVAVADILAPAWQAQSRFREARAISLGTLDVRRDYRVLHNAARAEEVLGEASSAREHYEEALAACPSEDAAQGVDVAGERGSILTNMAGLMAQQGNVKGAMELYQQSLKLEEQIGDIRGKAATLHQMAGLMAQQGDVQGAMRLYQESLKLEVEIGDIRGRAATLHQMAGLIAQQGNVKGAMDLYQQSLKLEEQIGDIRGKATTIQALAVLTAQQGDVKGAMGLYQESLKLEAQIGDVRGQAATLHALAVLTAQQGDVKGAKTLYQESLKIKEQVGDIEGKAATFHAMAWLLAQQGDLKAAMTLCHEALKLEHQIGDAQGKAVTLHAMAVLTAQQGDVERAMTLCHEALKLEHQIGDVRGRAATLANLAFLARQSGDLDKGWELYLTAARALASVRAWLDLATVLRHLGSFERPEAGGCLAQAMWLVLRVEFPVDSALQLAAALLARVGVEAEVGPLIATMGYYLAVTRGKGHPKEEELQQLGMGMISACAQARKMTPDEFAQWARREQLDDPGIFIPRLARALEALVPEGSWLVDRGLFQNAP